MHDHIDPVTKSSLKLHLPRCSFFIPKDLRPQWGIAQFWSKLTLPPWTLLFYQFSNLLVTPICLCLSLSLSLGFSFKSEHYTQSSDFFFLWETSFIHLFMYAPWHQVSFSVTLYLIFWDWSSYWTWNSLIWLDWLSSNLQEFMCLCLPQCWGETCAAPGWGSELTVSWLWSKHLPPQPLLWNLWHFPSCLFCAYTVFPFFFFPILYYHHHHQHNEERICKSII